MIEKIADLVKDKVLTEICATSPTTPTSTGMRIEIELKRDAIPQVALNKLFKHTALQTTFGYNAVALVDGVPRTLSLLELIRHYLDYQREVVTRRSKYELRKAEERAHVLEGYLIALDNLDEVIALIRAAADTDERAPAADGRASSCPRSRRRRSSTFGSRALTALERKKVEDEYADLQERIAELRAHPRRPARIDGVIREELLEIKEIYARNDDRRTEIVAAEEELELEDLIAEEDMVIAITRSGYIKRLPVTAYREQRRGGIGVMGMDLKDEDYIEHLFVASTHDYILFFTTVGKVYRLKVHELPLGSRQSKGRAIVNLLPFRQGEQVRAVIQTREFKEAEYLVFATKNGVVKKTKLEAYNTPLKADGIIAIKMREGDELVGVRHSTGNDDVLMVSRAGQAIRFAEKDVRPMGRDASGVQGMRLRAGDEVISINIAHNDADLLVVTENGYGKRTRIDEYPRKGRGGMGVKTVQLTEAKGKLAGARVVREGYQVMLISNGGTVIRMPVEEVKRLGRSTQGVIVMRLREGEQVSTLAPVVESESADTEDVRARRYGRRRFRRRISTNAPFQRATRGCISKCCAGSVQLEARHRMAISRQVDLLEPVNLADHLTKVELYLGQVCQIAGISKMQLDYWTNKAQIPTKGKKQRIYDIDALETVMLIKQAKDKGLNLGAAIEAARRFREENSARSAAADFEPSSRLVEQRFRRVLGRERVDPPAGAELDAGEDRQPRQQLEVPVGRVV